jgi:TetR/AcrR family transcriptional repressor of nem operon
MARPREFDYDEALDRAMLLFWRRGYQATSITDIESATGLTKGSIYKAFDNKRNLFVKCLERYMVNESYKAILLRNADRPLAEAFGYVLDVLIDSVSGSDRPCGCLATNVIDELVSVDKGLLRKCSQGLAGMQHLLEVRLRGAKERAELRPDTNVEALASLLMVTLQGLVVLSMSTKDVASMRRVRDFVINVLENS